MYDILSYADMVANQVRMDAYVQALQQTIKPGAIVLDIGTGTGICALLACRFGASRVYAIEPNSAVQAAREIAVANGYAEQIEFIQDLSTAVSLPEQADVIVSDLRGMLPLFQHHLPSIIDARQRLLAPGGTLIPQSDTLWVALVDGADLYAQYVNPWQDNTYGFDVGATTRYLTNSCHKDRVKPDQLLVDPQCWATIDYTTVESPHVSGCASWVSEGAATAHGLLVWFDAMLAPGIHYSNAPSAPELVYQSAFFPLTKPIMLAEGDAVSVRLHANLIGSDYIWRWETTVVEQGQQQVKANFKQSTFWGQPLSAALLGKREINYAPLTNERGCVDKFILGAMDGRNRLGDIAQQAFAQFPGHFKEPQEALAQVRTLSEFYSHD